MKGKGFASMKNFYSELLTPGMKVPEVFIATGFIVTFRLPNVQIEETPISQIISLLLSKISKRNESLEC